MMNDETEQFERRLSRQPLRQVPSEWRAEILAAARAAQPSSHSSLATHFYQLSTINSQLYSGRTPKLGRDWRRFGF